MDYIISSLCNMHSMHDTLYMIMVTFIYLKIYTEQMESIQIVRESGTNHTEKQTEKQTYKQTSKQTNNRQTQMGTQKDRQTDRDTDREKDQQTYIQTERKTYNKHTDK